MRLQTRALVLIPTYVIGGFILLVLVVSYWPMNAAAVALLGWLLTFGALQFLILCCPHCSKVAFITPRGWTALPAATCRYCGRAH